VFSAVALVAVAAVVTFVAIEGLHGAKPNGSAPTGPTLAAFVTQSARSTLALKTADISLTATVNIGGTTAHLHGTGQADFAANTLELTARASRTALVEREIITGHALYLQVIVNGQNMADFDGRHWFGISPAKWLSQIEPQDSAISLLRLLERDGATVIAMGTQNIGGLNCTEVTVTPTMQAMLAAMQQESANDGLSSPDAAAAQSLLKKSPPPTLTVWLDPRRDLTCQVAVDIQLGSGLPSGSGGAPSTETAQMLVRFTHYGVPVHISAPARSDTVSF
jgi:hypothetical protein